MEFSIILKYLPQYLSGAGVTIQLTIEALVLGLIGGLAVAMCKMSKIRVLRVAASAYISIIRGTPLLLQLVFIFYSLPSIGITLDAMSAGVWGLGLNMAAYMAETFRAGIMAIPKGQWEVAYVLGYSRMQSYVHIILPQAIRIVLPQIGNTAVAMIKDTSLVSVITITELMRTAQVSYAVTFRPLEAYLLAGIIYYVLSVVVSRCFAFMEMKMDRY